MEEFLQRAWAKLNRSKHLEKVHVVLGNKSCDLDSLISALAYAYFLDKVSPPDVLCLPVLNMPRRDFSYFTETRFILEELNIPESFHIFRDEINLHQLNAEGKLSLTLVNSNTLTSEDKSLESAVVKVINPDEQHNSSLELQASSSSLVVKEILQEAPELITRQLAYLLRGGILFKCMSLEPERITEQLEKVLSILEKKFPDLPPREKIISVLQEAQFNPQGISMEEVMLKDLKELSDGEIKVAISTVYMTLESSLLQKKLSESTALQEKTYRNTKDCMLHRSLIGDLKAFIDKYGFDVLVILANYLSDEEQTKQRIAVYSENLELGSQICCELEECQNPCLELDPLECECDQILIYHQENSLVTCDQIFLLVREVINRRQPEMVSNSRTSSTEAVAGSAPLSQGSSGIMELYGSDVEPQPSSTNFIENPQELNGSIPAHMDVNVDLVSPDSGLATIRSSRSSKESSVFLSDDSPVTEGAASHHSLLPGFDSYSPIPEGTIAEQKPQSRNNSNNFDLFNFDLAPMVTAPSESSSHSIDCSPADDFFLNSDSSEGQPPTVRKELNEANLLENDIANYSTDLLMATNEEDNLAEFDENPGDICEKTSSLIDLVEGDSSSPEMLKSADSRIPPTPMNNLVETSPLDNGQPLFFPQDVVKKINEMDSSNYSQSHVRYGSWWDGFDIIESRNADTWSSSEQESLFQSPVLWKDCKASPLLREHIGRASDSVFLQKQPKQMEYTRAGLWDNQFKQDDSQNLENEEKNTERSHLQTASFEETEQELENFTDPWKASQPIPVVSDVWCTGEGKGGQLAGDSYEVWTKFDAEDIAKSSENIWNMPKLDREKKSVNNPEEWEISKTSLSEPSEITADNETENPPIQVSPEAWYKERYYSIGEHGTSENTNSSINNMQNNFKLQTEEKNVLVDPKHRLKQFENIEPWNLYDKNIRKEVTEVVVPWEDTFSDYKCSDLSSSNIGEDLVVSPLYTNYSTSDSYISPTYVGDERENEDKDFDKVVTDKFINPNLDEPKVLEKADKEPLSPRNMPFSSSRNTALNNETQLKERNSEITALSATGTPLLNSEQTANQYFSTEKYTRENNFSISQNRRITPVYNRTVNDLSLPQNELNTRCTSENVETVSNFPVEETGTSTTTSDAGNDLNLKAFDLGSEILGKEEAQNTVDDEKLDSWQSVQEPNLWSLQTEQDCEEGWENYYTVFISQEGKEECKRIDETNGQQNISDICNIPVQGDSESSCNAESEENRSMCEVPSSLEKMRNSVSSEALDTENMSFSNDSNLVSQKEKKELLQNNTESSSSASEEDRNYESFDDSKPQNYSYSEISQPLSEKGKKEITVIVDASVNAWGDLPVASHHKENRDMWDFTNDKKLEEAYKRKEFGNECQEGLETSTEHKVPKNLDFWNAHVDDDTVSSLSNPEINEDSENSDTCPTAINEDSTYEKKKHRASEIEEDYAQSNATSPETDEDNLHAKTNVGEEVQVGILNENLETIKAGNISKDDLTITEPNEASEHLDHWETLQKKAQETIFSEKTGTAEDSYLHQVNEDDTLTYAVDDKEEYSSKALDMWNMSLEADLRFEPKSTVEIFGFPDDSSEWWNSQTCEEKLVEDQYSTSSLPVANPLINSKQDSWGPSIPNEELEDAHFTDPSNDGIQAPHLYCSEKENERLAQSMNIHDSQINQDTVQFKQFDPFILDKEGRDLKEQPFPTDEGDQLIPQNPFSEDCEPSMSSTSVQENTILAQPNDNEGDASLIPQEQQLDTCETLEVPDAFTVEDLSFEMTEKSSPGWNILVPQTALIPAILQDNTQESNQLFSVEPDLWTNAEQLFTLKGDNENPDILSHCDQDNSSEASSSPDVSQEYDARHASLLSSQTEVEPEDSQLICTLSNMSKEVDFDSKYQLVMQKLEAQSESDSPQDYDQGKTDESYQLISPNTQEPSALVILEEYGLERKLVTEQIKTVKIPTEVLGVTSLDLKDIFHESNIPASHQETPLDSAQTVNSQTHFIPTDFTLRDMPEQSLKEMSALAETEKYSDIDCTIITSDELEISDECMDGSETGVEHNISNTSVTNIPSSTCNGMSTLTIVGSEAAERDSSAKQIFFPRSFLSGDNEDHESDSSNQLVDDIVKEPEHIIENDAPVFKGMPSDQSPVMCASPSHVSLGAEPSGSRECAKNELLLQQPFCDTVSLEKRLPLLTPQGDAEGTLMIKDDSVKDQVPDTSTECPQEEPVLVSLLLESEVAPGASEILKGIKHEAETTDLNSPPGGDKRSPNEAATDPLCRENKPRNSSESPELKSTEGKEDMRMQVHRDQTSLQMDYILVTREENTPSRKDTLEKKGSDFTFQEVNVAEQTESHEGFSPGSSDTFQPISIINEREGHCVWGTEWDSVNLAEKSSSFVPQKLDDERRLPENCGQDEGWIILGRNEVSYISPEEISARLETPKSGSGHSGEELEAVIAQESILDTQAEFQLEAALHKSSERGGCCPLDSLTTEDENITRADALMLQVVGGDGVWEANSQQRLGNNVVTEQEMEEETVLLNSGRKLSQRSGLVPENVGMDSPFAEGVLSPSSTEIRPEPPNSLDLNGSHPRRIKLTAPNISLSLDQSEESVLSDDNLDTPDEIDINVDDLDTPDEADSFEYTGQEDQTAIKDASQEESKLIPEYTAEEEREDNRLWRTVVIGEQEQRIDMKVIEPYKKVISHGGYYGDGLNAIIVFAACFLPDSSRTDYNYVMENLFLYVISTLELMVAEDYMIVYLNGATPRKRMPGLGWMKKCYQMIDRRLRKNLKSFIIVHPSWFIRTILAVTRPFISSKFSSKIQYVSTLAELCEMIPMEYVHIPESIVKLDEELGKLQKQLRVFS